MPVARIGEAFDEALEAFTGFLMVAAVAVLVLALLIAFNAARISVEERRRDHATMRCVRPPVRVDPRDDHEGSIVIGVMATLIGVAVGTVMLDWMLDSLAARTLPDFGIDRYIAPSTLAWAAGIGIIAVSVAPLFLVAPDPQDGPSLDASRHGMTRLSRSGSSRDAVGSAVTAAPRGRRYHGLAWSHQASSASSTVIDVWNDPCLEPQRTDSQFHPPSASCWSSNHSTVGSRRGSSWPNAAASSTNIPVMHVSGSRMDFARVNPPPYQRALSHNRRHPARACGSPPSSPKRSRSSSVYVVEVHFGP